jgi:glutaredoxin
MDNIVILYTMEGCPFCDMIKNQLTENGIEFYNRDIEKYSDEFDMFVEIVGSEYVPAFMIVEDSEGENPKPHLFSPDNDFNTIEEGVDIIKKYIL